MLIQVPDVLTADEVRHCRAVLEASQWVDGRVTAGDQAAKAKNNLQIPAESAEAVALGDLILQALGRNPTYNSAALPLRVLPPMFNRYDVGMTFGAHVDNSIRTVPGTGGMRLRADVSTTIFLSDPGDYEGGELVIEDTFGTHAVKLPAGHMVVYPASSLHRVMPVTRGSRWASFFWAQSMIKDDGLRAMLYDLDVSIIAIRAELGDENPAVLGLVSHYHNLLRRWAEL
ncbi:Fe2+-dependent dioxygenase [Rhizobium sp. CSW-27]|uniref:Fe2+-dependent dioxygenase n=1 Tax=Rhizobium sp. CSW-27 TaxID=2839985 RepID=UPI001C02B248|nr:Fe2+-dependent dioxygenase [Rhizobium sp. CSW-27]MBT9370153.1 Fe2+-dependent dioxygenase [Rhizobium sp. CSW-27]